MVCEAHAAALKAGKRYVYNSVENVIYMGQDAPPQSKVIGPARGKFRVIGWRFNLKRSGPEPVLRPPTQGPDPDQPRSRDDLGGSGGRPSTTTSCHRRRAPTL